MNMMYKLKDKKDKRFKIVGTLENILEFLNYPSDLNFTQTKYKLQEDEQYNNKDVSYYIEETHIYVAEKESGELVADARDISQAMAVIEMFEWEDENNDDYDKDYYMIVDDDGEVIA